MLKWFNFPAGVAFAVFGFIATILISEPEPTAEVISINDNDDDDNDDDESEVKDEQVSLKPRQVLRTSTFYQVHLLLKS